MGALLDLAKRAGGSAEDQEPGRVMQRRDIPGQIARDPHASSRMASALAYLDANPDVQRACFYHALKSAPVVILTVAVREPRAALEMSISRERFDAMRLFELSLNHPGTSVFVPEH